jgi:hypothetical protein
MSPPSGLSRLGTGLHGAMLLARGRADGLWLVAARDEPVLAAARRSFWAAALCAPAFLCLTLIDFAQSPPAHPAHALALQLLGYVVDWTGFALLSRSAAHAMGRLDAWPRYIAAWNWCNVVQYVLAVGAALPQLLGLPVLLSQTVWLVGTGWALWIEWYATRLALGVNGIQAAGMVLLDEALGFILLAAIAATLGG